MSIRDRLSKVEEVRWLEDGGSARTRDWLAEQDRRTDEELATLPAAAWVEDLVRGGLEPEPTWIVRGNRSFRLQPGDGRAPSELLCRDPAGTERALVSTAGTVVRWSVSPAGTRIAAQVVHAGDERHTPLHLGSADGQAREVVVHDVRRSAFEWIDENSLAYVHALPDGRESVVRHDVRTGEVAVLLELADPALRCSVRLWHRRWLTVCVRRGTAARNTAYRIDLADRVAELLQDTDDAVTVPIVARDGALVLLTTYAADTGRIVRPGRPAHDRTAWETIVPEDPAAPVVAADLVGEIEHLVVVRTRDGRTSVSAHDVRTGRQEAELALPGAGPVVLALPADGTGNPRLRYTDWVTPPTDLELDLPGRALRLPGTPSAGVHSLQARCTSADGTSVPVRWLGPADASGPVPTLITLYGGFGKAVRPTYQADSLAWVRAGGAVVVADVRGGGGHGSAWHRDGARERKQNSLDDLHAVADWLVATGRATREQLVLFGASHGGLMVAAALVQSPERYGAGVAISPLTDMAGYQRGGLGAQWVEEYGDADDPAQLAYLLGYSPCHNVRSGRRYPPLLLVTGANDTRVDPAHARKLVALLQAVGAPAFLREVPDAGHAGNGRSQQAVIASSALAFLAAHAGLA